MGEDSGVTGVYSYGRQIFVCFNMYTWGKGGGGFANKTRKGKKIYDIEYRNKRGRTRMLPCLLHARESVVLRPVERTWGYAYGAQTSPVGGKSEGCLCCEGVGRGSRREAERRANDGFGFF